MKIKLILTSLFFFCWAQFSYAQEPVEEEEPLQWFQVEKKAEFPGGDAALNKYISENFRFSDSALENAKSGVLMVSFVIEKNGSVSNVKIVSTDKLGYGLEEEALRLFRTMPKWKPAVQRDQPVRMRFSKPVRLTF